MILQSLTGLLDSPKADDKMTSNSKNQGPEEDIVEHVTKQKIQSFQGGKLITANSSRNIPHWVYQNP